MRRGAVALHGPPAREGVRLSEPRDREPETISAEKARQGQIVLDTRSRRWIFLGGLVAIIVIALVLKLALLW